MWVCVTETFILCMCVCMFEDMGPESLSMHDLLSISASEKH